MAKYYYTNMISALATGQISYRDAMCEILKRLCDLENENVQYQADWTETDSTSPSYIQHKPSVQEFQADWNETNSTAYGYIQNKPEIVGQAQADWTETDADSPAFIKNKPSVQEFQADWNETNSTAYGYIQNKPEIPEQVQADWTETDVNNKGYIKNKPGVTQLNSSTPTLVPPTAHINPNNILHANGVWSGLVSNYISWSNGISPVYEQDFQDIINKYQNKADGTETDPNSPSFIQNKPKIVGQVQADWTETDADSPAFIKNKPMITSALYPRASWSRYTQCFAYHGTLPAGANNVWGLQCVQEWIPGKFWHFHGWVCLYTADNSGVTTPFFNYGIDMGSVVEHTDLTVADLYQAYTSSRMYSQSKKYVRYTDSAIDPSDAFAALQFTEQQIGGVIELTYDADAAYPCLGRHCAYVYNGSTTELQDYPLAQQKPGFIEFEIWVNAES